MESALAITRGADLVHDIPVLGPIGVSALARIAPICGSDASASPLALQIIVDVRSGSN
jgi:hypothetical protein